jgi:hypothetical protein
MSDIAPERFESRPISIQPSDWDRITRMAQAKRLNPSALCRMLILPQVEAWERENGIQAVVETELSS